MLRTSQVMRCSSRDSNPGGLAPSAATRSTCSQLHLSLRGDPPATQPDPQPLLWGRSLCPLPPPSSPVPGEPEAPSLLCSASGCRALGMAAC